MTHRIPNRRWLENPEHRVGAAQLNHVQEAVKRSEPDATPRQRPPSRRRPESEHDPDPHES